MAPIKQRQMRPQWDEERILALAREMSNAGHLGLKVEKSRLQLKSLAFLEAFNHLESLTIYGIARDLPVVRKLSRLRSFGLAGLSTRDLSFLTGLKHLEDLYLQGLRLKDWASVGQLTQVKRLTLFNLWHADVSFLESMTALQEIRLDWCSQVEALPSLARLTNLRRVILDTTSKLGTLDGIIDAPALEDLILLKAKALPVEAVATLNRHPALRNVVAGLGTVSRDEEARGLLDDRLQVAPKEVVVLMDTFEVR